MLGAARPRTACFTYNQPRRTTAKKAWWIVRCVISSYEYMTQHAQHNGADPVSVVNAWSTLLVNAWSTLLNVAWQLLHGQLTAALLIWCCT